MNNIHPVDQRIQDNVDNGLISNGLHLTAAMITLRLTQPTILSTPGCNHGQSGIEKPDPATATNGLSEVWLELPKSKHIAQ